MLFFNLLDLRFPRVTAEGGPWVSGTHRRVVPVGLSGVLLRTDPTSAEFYVFTELRAGVAYYFIPSAGVPEFKTRVGSRGLPNESASIISQNSGQTDGLNLVFQT